MHVQPVHALLAMPGLIVPHYFFIRFLLENGFDIALHAGQLFASDISTFVVADAVIPPLAVLAFVLTGRPEKNVHPLWLPALGTMVVGAALRPLPAGGRVVGGVRGTATG